MSRSSGTKTKLLKLLSHAAPDGTNILGIAEGICAKFTEKMCLLPRSDELNVKVKGQGHNGQNTCLAVPSLPAAYKWYVLNASSVQQQQTPPFHPIREVISGACMRFWFIFFMHSASGRSAIYA